MHVIRLQKTPESHLLRCEWSLNERSMLCKHDCITSLPGFTHIHQWGALCFLLIFSSLLFSTTSFLMWVLLCKGDYSFFFLIIGSCYPCPVTVDVKCNCGKTMLTVPCGRERSTKPPRCKAVCRYIKLSTTIIHLYVKNYCC